MRADTPALNIIVSLVYISVAGGSMFLLKLASKPRLFRSSKQQSAEQEQSVEVYRRMGLSWLRKYSIVGVCVNADKKYLAKELLILSVYGVACLKINRITLWPLALAAFLLPAIFFLYEIALKLQRNSQNLSQKNGNEVQIAVQSENLEGVKVVSIQQAATKKITKQFRNAFEIAAISTIAFVAVVLDFQAVMVLDKSISNSGELNLISVVCIILLDQLILRPVSGLILMGIIKLLEHRQVLSIHQNKLVGFLCEQLLLEEQLLEEQRRVRAEHESAQNHPKQKQEDQLQDATNVPIKPDHARMEYIDLQHIQPQAKQSSSPHEAFSHSLKEVVDEEEVFLTTPEKELFQVDVFSNNYETIVNTYLCNKQNAENLSNASNVTYQPNKQEINSFDELILTKDHQALRNIQNIEPCFKNQTEMEEQMKKGQNKRKNKRVLKLTGKSPYLQYLPNMLKNVRKPHAVGVTATPKAAQINLR